MKRVRFIRSIFCLGHTIWLPSFRKNRIWPTRTISSITNSDQSPKRTRRKKITLTQPKVVREERNNKQIRVSKASRQLRKSGSRYATFNRLECSNMKSQGTRRPYWAISVLNRPQKISSTTKITTMKRIMMSRMSWIRMIWLRSTIS